MNNGKLTEEIIVEAEKLLKMGNYVVTVCGCLDIEESTWYNWIKYAKEATKKLELGEILTKSEALHLKFLKSTTRARNEATNRNVSIIQKAATEDWKASAWWLERTKANLFAQKATIVIEDKMESIDMNEVNQFIEEVKTKKELEKAKLLESNE